MKHPNFFSLLKKSFKAWQEDNITTWSAALSYYTVFAISPILLLLISITSIFIDQRVLREDLFLQLQAAMGREAATLITNSLAAAKEQGGIGATIIGFILLIMGASGIFGQLRSTLNHIFRVKAVPQNAMTGFFKQKLTGFLMILAIGILLFLSVGATAFLTILSNFFSTVLPVPQFTLELGNFILSFLIITLLFVLIYTVLPSVNLPRSILWKGSLLTALLFTIGKTILGLYLGSGAVGSGFGAASALAVILVWIYYSSLIFFFGAELIKTYAYAYNIQLEPKENAISTLPIKPEKEVSPIVERILSYILSGIALRLLGRIFKKNSGR